MNNPEHSPTILEAPPEPRAHIHAAYESVAPSAFRSSLTSLWEIDDPASDEDGDGSDPVLE